MSRHRYAARSLAAAVAVAAFVPVGGALAAEPGSRVPASPPVPSPLRVVPASPAVPGSPAVTGTMPSPPPGASASSTPCVQQNGGVRHVSPTTLTFTIPGFACYPQAIFTVYVYASAADGASGNVAGRGTGGRDTGVVVVSGLDPATAYWYRFSGAVLAGPVSTSSSASATPSTAAPGACSAGYTVLSQWPDGFHAQVTVTAARSPIAAWSLTWQLSPGQHLRHSWGAETDVAADGTVTARNAAWNGTLPAHGTTTMGLIGTGQAGPAPAVTCR